MHFLSLLLLNLFLISYSNSQFTNVEVLERDLVIEKLGIYEDAIRTPVSMIRKHKYPVKEYETKTKDGYIITILRIPYGIHNVTRNNIPVLLIPGFSCKLNIFVNQYNSMGYFLVENGYDVWLGNKRSTIGYSRHEKYSTLSSKYWDFSWEEEGLYDLPATIDTVLKTTGSEQLILLSYSMSSSSVLALHATNPEYNAKVARHIALGPVAIANYETSVIGGLLIPFRKILTTLYNLLIVGEGIINYFFLRIMAYVAPAACLLAGNYNCQAIFSYFLGYHHDLYGSKIILVAGETMAGVSFKTGLHLFQQAVSKEMRRYDYGTHKNLQVYGTKLPPAYNFSRITCPTSFLYGANDPAASPLNVEAVAMQMKSVNKVKMDYDMFTHTDFAWSVKPFLKNDVNRKVLAEIKNTQLKPNRKQNII